MKYEEPIMNVIYLEEGEVYTELTRVSGAPGDGSDWGEPYSLK